MLIGKSLFVESEKINLLQKNGQAVLVIQIAISINPVESIPLFKSCQGHSLCLNFGALLSQFVRTKRTIYQKQVFPVKNFTLAVSAILLMLDSGECLSSK